MSRYGSDGIGCFATAVILAIVLAVFAVAALNIDPASSVDAAEAYGFSDVEIVEVDRFLASIKGCGEDDWIAVTLEATNVAGARVRLLACSGFLKAWTIRVR